MADLDAKAAALRQAHSWQTYPYFMFARYAHLRPAKDSKNYQQKLKAWESQIASHPQAKRALERLDAMLREQLVALLVDVISDLEAYKHKTARPPKAFRTEAQRRNRVLKSKREKALRALEDLCAYAADLDPLLAGDDAEATKRCLKILDSVREYDFGPMLSALAGSHPVRDNPTVRGMIDLYWFFRSGCELPGDEAEVRVALLRNAFWTRYGISRVEYLPIYRTGESKGCSAVHEAVRRFRPSQGTSD